MNMNLPQKDATVNSNSKFKQLTSNERTAILQALLQQSKNSVLKQVMITNAAKEFQVTPLTISRVW